MQADLIRLHYPQILQWNFEGKNILFTKINMKRSIFHSWQDVNQAPQLFNFSQLNFKHSRNESSPLIANVPELYECMWMNMVIANVLD